jgi:hypothetical protein
LETVLQTRAARLKSQAESLLPIRKPVAPLQLQAAMAKAQDPVEEELLRCRRGTEQALHLAMAVTLQ